MRRLAVLALSLSLVAASGCMDPSDFPVIGIDADGNATQVLISENDYSSKLTATVSAYQDSALPVLQKRPVAGAAGPWMLRTVAVGIGINTEIGVGDLVKIGAAPKLRLVFSNSSDPVVP